MPKILNESMHLILELRKEDNEVVIECTASYEVSAEEYDMSERRDFKIPLTSAQETAIKNFVAQAIPKIKAHEDIT